MAKVARGKALVARLRAQPGVKNPEALAAYLGRFKAARKAGRSVAESRKVARGEGPAKDKAAGALADRVRAGSRPEAQRRPSVFAGRPAVEDDDPFAEDFGPVDPKTKEDLQRERMEAQLIRQMEKADRQKVYQAIQEQGGLKTNAALQEEYSGIPNTFKRKGGMGGDEMADHLATYYPELGIQTERDLIDYLAA